MELQLYILFVTLVFGPTLCWELGLLWRGPFLASALQCHILSLPWGSSWSFRAPGGSGAHRWSYRTACRGCGKSAWHFRTASDFSRQRVVVGFFGVGRWAELLDFLFGCQQGLGWLDALAWFLLLFLKKFYDVSIRNSSFLCALISCFLF